MKKALDLFCGAGGASRGLRLAGFHVTGVDLKPQKRYVGDAFHQADALAFPLDGFDFIWASPPCQAFTRLKSMWNKREPPNLIPQARARLAACGVPYCIENVEGAPLGDSGYLIMLCGSMFGLKTGDCRAELRRHRLFETSFSIPLRPRCQHTDGAVIGVYGHAGGKSERRASHKCFLVAERREAMAIPWMTNEELSQAIPAAYSEFIGREALAHMAAASNGAH